MFLSLVALYIHCSCEGSVYLHRMLFMLPTVIVMMLFVKMLFYRVIKYLCFALLSPTSLTLYYVFFSKLYSLLAMTLKNI